ncbi:MAG: serine/threonine-protein phosphatase [Limnochordaceae bacterium]|nr:serine/threonine-protein phosphatase [Limnochordaceae bacterium]
MVHVLAAGRTERGHVRPINEDGFLTLPPVFAVADGMGGHQGGEIASRIALQVMGDFARRGPWSAAGLAGAVELANQEIRAAARKPEWQGMGTTLTAALWDGTALHLVHVGDSRAYLLREGQPLLQLTQDHSIAGELLTSGLIDSETARHHPQRHILTRALGVFEKAAADQVSLTPSAGDIVLLCTDGLTGVLAPSEVELALRRPGSLEHKVKRLVRWANARGGPDNITALALTWVSGNQLETGEGEARS